MEKMKIALVGCGGMAERYRYIYTQIPGAELALLIDSVAETAIKASEACGNVKWSTRFEDCLVPDIGIIDISTPNHLHREQAVAAIEAGKHVLLQKPMANSLKNAEAIAKAASLSDKTIGMYMFLFDNPLFYDIKDIITQGKLGVISGTHCRTAHRGGLVAKPGSWRASKEKTGGGSFIQLAVHNMNMLQWLIDSRVKSVTGYCKNMMCPIIGGDDTAALAYEYESGVLGTVSSSFCAEKDELSIYSSKGYICLDDFRYLTIRMDNTFIGNVIRYETPGTRVTIELPPHNTENNPHNQHVAFVNAAMKGEPAQISIETGLYDMRIIDAVYRSSESGKKEYVHRLTP